jgi:hypothetical protein
MFDQWEKGMWGEKFEKISDGRKISLYIFQNCGTIGKSSS